MKITIECKLKEITKLIDSLAMPEDVELGWLGELLERMKEDN